jgi:hypothetical protein
VVSGASMPSDMRRVPTWFCLLPTLLRFFRRRRPSMTRCARWLGFCVGDPSLWSLDDGLGRSAAELLGIPLTVTLGVLISSRKKGLRVGRIIRLRPLRACGVTSLRAERCAGVRYAWGLGRGTRGLRGREDGGLVNRFFRRSVFSF